MIVDTKQATQDIIKCIKAKLPVMLHGDPGCGKSDIVHQIAGQYNLKLIDIRLSQIDPTELNGFPSIKEDIATYVPMDIFPLETTPLDKHAGFLVFLDEFNSASVAVQAASYKLVLDKKVGQYNLHPNAAIVCAGNKTSNNAIVNRLSTAMQSRLIHLELGINIQAWIDWATKAKIDHRIISYLHNRPELLHKFDPDHNDYTFASPRTWEFASKLIKNKTDKLNEMTAVLSGTVSEAIAREFIMYAETYTRLPTIAQIMQDPVNTPIDDEPSMLFAVAHMLAAHTTKQNIPTLMKYIERLPLEFETITLQDVIQKDKSMLEQPAIEQWVLVKGMDLF